MWFRRDWVSVSHAHICYLTRSLCHALSLSHLKPKRKTSHWSIYTYISIELSTSIQTPIIHRCLNSCLSGSLIPKHSTNFEKIGDFVFFLVTCTQTLHLLVLSINVLCVREFLTRHFFCVHFFLSFLATVNPFGCVFFFFALFLSRSADSSRVLVIADKLIDKNSKRIRNR